MSERQKLITVRDRVFFLLSLESTWRDDDNQLIYYYWKYYVLQEGTTESPKQFQYDYYMGLIPWVTIYKVRQKLQHEFPGLRGKNYNERLEKGRILKPEYATLTSDPTKYPHEP